jgi:hypothetical protein
MGESEFKSGPALASAEIIAAAVERPTVQDKRGRTITLRKLGPVQRTRLLKVIGPDSSRNLPLVGYYTMAVSVFAINGEEEAFPTKEMQLEGMLERLGDDGLEAVAEGWKKAGWSSEDEGKPDAIKN